jgi:hypothetical protein
MVPEQHKNGLADFDGFLSLRFPHFMKQHCVWGVWRRPT